MQKLRFLTFVYFCAVFFNLQAQNPASINVNNLSDQQIQQIVNEVNSRGLTIDQAAQMAQMQGATPAQIDQIKRRIQELNFSKGNSIANPQATGTQASEVKREAFSEKAVVQASPKAKRIFGFQLFNAENLTFEPPVNIPTPQNYVLGIDDELTVSIWGASQQTYQLRIETTGAVSIPDIGPVYVSGMEFLKAKELIKKRLISIYQGMDGSSPNTWADVSISNLRSIKINVIGEVMVPGTYTLPSTASVFNALYLSGGPNENGSFRSIQVIRDNKIIKTIDVYDYLINANTQGNIPLREQDVIYIPTYQKRVEAGGAFKRTGIFELTEKEKLTDLIRYLGGFTDQAFKAQLSLTRITDKEKKIIDINQSLYESFVPANGDLVVASEIMDRYENRVLISGAVFRPGTYELTDGMTISQLIARAQGVKENFYSNRGLIIRLQDNLSPMTLPFDVKDILRGVNDMKLQREDQVIIQDIFSMRQKRSIQILGEVQRPGEYDFLDNMTLKDLIFQAGGLNEVASESFVELARRHNYQEASQTTDQMVKLFQFNIDRQLKLDSKDEAFLLEPFDYIYIRRSPSYFEQRTVIISGEVKYPGPYSISSKSERISDLINRAGGLLPDAFIKGARMKRANPLAGQYLQSMQNSPSDSLLTKAKQQIYSEQLELKLESILQHPGSNYDYLLKAGDEIHIPELAQEVRISGEILNPIGLAYEQGKGLKYYIDRSGGFSNRSHKSKTFVIYSDGTTGVTHNFIWRNYPNLEPGCQIVVPKKPEKQRVDSTGKWLGIASTMGTIAIAIATLLSLGGGATP
jgi:protein involved in polysaccharide export with SLBB domain